MSKALTVGNSSIEVKEYCGQRVITLKDVDTVHERLEGTARKCFNRNQKHLLPQLDFFVLKTDEAWKAFKTPAPNGLVLLTESGYLMIVKSFTDDLAWTVQRQLVNAYFKQQPPLALPQPNKTQYTDVPENIKIQNQIAYAKNTIIALSELLEYYDKYHTVELAEASRLVLKAYGYRVYITILDLVGLKYKTLNKI